MHIKLQSNTLWCLNVSKSKTKIEVQGSVSLDRRLKNLKFSDNFLFLFLWEILWPQPTDRTVQLSLHVHQQLSVLGKSSQVTGSLCERESIPHCAVVLGQSWTRTMGNKTSFLTRPREQPLTRRKPDGSDSGLQSWSAEVRPHAGHRTLNLSLSKCENIYPTAKSDTLPTTAENVGERAGRKKDDKQVTVYF